MIPNMPTILKCSWKTKTPINTVANKLITDQVAPTIES